jgi:hypothetical protein
VPVIACLVGAGSDANAEIATANKAGMVKKRLKFPMMEG